MAESKRITQKDLLKAVARRFYFGEARAYNELEQQYLLQKEKDRLEKDTKKRLQKETRKTK